MSRPDAAPGLLRLAIARHWLGIAAFAVLVGIPATTVMAAQPAQTYRATRAYLVGVPVPIDGQVVTTNTDRAARDYGTVLRRDSVLLAKLARAVHTSVAHVRDHLDAGYVPGSSALFVRYESSKRAEGDAVFAELDRLIRAEGIPTSSLPKGVVRPLGGGQVEVRRSYLRVVPGEGLLLAVLLAVVVAVLVERMRPDVRSHRHLQAQTDRSVLWLSDAADLNALAVRALRKTGRVRVLGVDGDADGERLAARLSVTADALVAQGALPADHGSIEPARLPTVSEPGDRWLVVAPVGSLLRPVEQALDALAEAGDVIVVVDRTRDVATAAVA